MGPTVSVGLLAWICFINIILCTIGIRQGILLQDNFEIIILSLWAGCSFAALIYEFTR